MKRGYLPLYRKIQEHEFYLEKREFSKFEAWIDILMEVQHRTDTTDVLIGMKILKCKYGQSLKSLRTWGKRWGWSVKKVSRFFKLLSNMDQICTENATITTRLTVLNYNKYDPKCHTCDTQPTHDGNTSDTRATHKGPTDKNVKKEKNVKNDKKNTPDPFRKHLLDKITETNLSSFEPKIIEFYNYRMAMNKKDRYQTEKGINGLIRNILELHVAGKNINDCLEFSMEKNWKSPELRYFDNQKPIKKDYMADGYYKKSSTDGKDNPLF